MCPYTTDFFIHLPLFSLVMFEMQRANQSIVIAIHTHNTPGIGLPSLLFSQVNRYANPILNTHIMTMETLIRYFTSPDALKTAGSVHAAGHIKTQHAL